MKKQHILLLAVLILLLLPDLTFGVLPRYEIIDLGTLGGYTSRAYAINDVGQVVGCSINVSGNTRAFIWENGIMTDLGTLGGDTSIAFDINNSGQVVGGTNMHAFLWDSTSGMIQLDNWVYSATADAINNYGTVVGRLRLQIGAAEHMFLCENHGMIDLGTILDSYFIYVSCISDSEQVVGTANVFLSGGLNGNAFLYENNIVTELGTLGGDYSGANGINSYGQIVGWSNILDGSIHAFLWDSSTGMRDLGTLGGNGSFAYAINDHGQVVGFSYTTDNDYDSIRAFIWDNNNGMVQLDEMLHADCEWKELRPQAINNRGQVVGQGITETGEPHAFLMTPLPPKIIFVDVDATDGNNGSSWSNAFTNLQDALAVAQYGDEIRVAEGIYKPDLGANIIPGDREASFQLINGVTIIGGYAGFGEPDPNARNIELYESILSGDLNGNDLPNFTNNDENSYHVVTGSGTDSSAVLDGFTITGGNANEGDTSPHVKGGGVYNYNGSPTISNCSIIGNATGGWWRSFGGGMYNTMLSHPTLTNCIFSENFARVAGGGILNEEDSTPILTNCTFSRNSAFYSGGGICGSAILTNCILSENSASSGGGICGSAILTNCILSGNSATEDGGAVKGNVTLINCTLSGNSAGEKGGGIYWPSPPMPLLFAAEPIEVTSSVMVESDITNCILWGNTPEQIYYYLSRPVITYSNIQGNWIGEGNIDADPLFFNPGYWDTNDVWVDGDYHLLEDSPCIDAGDPNYIAEPNETDLDGEPRVMGGRVDMGADEFTPTPTPILRIWPVEFLFSSYKDGPNPQARILSISNIGSGMLIWEIDEDCPWLHVHPTNGESIGEINEVTLNVDVSGMDLGIYDCQLAIAADGALKSPQMVAVTLNLGGSELYVPSEYETIQAAIDASIDWDIVVAADGIYTGPGNCDIDFMGKAITVRSENGPENCIIDCNGTEDQPHRGFYFHSGEETNSVLSGFTITNGYTDWGGGIYCKDSSPTITNCIFSNNSAWDGGAVYNADSDPYITNCIFTGNIVENYGGGMYNYDKSYTSVANSIFSGNRSEYLGGGIANSDNSNLTLTNCTISENWSHYGGGICCWNDVYTNLTNCILWDNDANTFYEEIYSDLDSYPDISYSNIRGWTESINEDPCFFEVEPDTGSWTANPSYDESTFQSTLTDDYASWTINQLAGKFINPDTANQDLHFFIVSNDANTINVWSDVESFVISGDPYQIYDYHLKLESACIDAGDPNYVAGPNETDLDGKPRVIGGRIDMGAYEYRPPIWAYVDIEPDTLNLASKGKWITAYIEKPEDYDMNDINANSVLLEGEIEAELFWLSEDNQVAIARFSRDEVQAILTVGKVELAITGQLKDGTLFEGTDIIRVINEGRRKN